MISLARYNPDGTLDGPFNSTGKVLTDFGGNDEAYGVTVQADGKIVVIGSFGLLVGTDHAEFALARYNVDGTLDASFNATGKVITNFGGNDYAFAVALDPNGKIVAAGFSDVQGTADFAVARYLP